MGTNQEEMIWPTGVPGPAIDDHMTDRDVGDVDVIQGNADGVTYNLWTMKEPDYVMKMMATSGILIAEESSRSTSRQWIEDGVQKRKEFSYKLPFDHHFRYCHAVDDHNNLRHSLPSWMDTWLTECWELHVLALILAVCEVNSYLAVRFIEGKKKMPTLLNFRRKYEWQLIMNDLVENTVEHYQLMLEGSHTLCRAHLMPGCTAIAIGFVMFFRSINNMLTGILGVKSYQNLLCISSRCLAMWYLSSLPCFGRAGAR